MTPSKPAEPPTDLEVLISARELLTSGWTQHVVARDKQGFVVHWDSIKVSRWSIRGALRKASGLDYRIEVPAERILEKLLGTDHTPGWEDESGRTLAEVLELMDRGIAVLKGKGAV